MIGGEGEENPIWMTHGTWISFAQRFVNKIINFKKYLEF
jgi:hypothetical protein